MGPGAVDPSASFRVLDGAPDAMFVVDVRGDIVFANERAEAMFGAGRPALAGAQLEGLLSPACRGAARDDLASLFASRAMPSPRVRDDLFAICAATGPVSIELSMNRTLLAGSPLAVVVLRDMTEQCRADGAQSAALAEARDARDQLEVLLEFAPAFILAVNPSGAIDFINRTLPQYSRESVIGTSWLLYFPPERQALMVEKMRAVYETGETQSFETVTPGPGGEALWFDSHIAPVRVGERIAGAVLVSQEVTARKREQAELLASRHMALLGTLAAGVAHEINTPIQFIGDSIKFLHDASGDLLTLTGKLQELRHSVVAGAPLASVIEAAEMAEEDADLPYLRANLPSAFDRCLDGLKRVTTIVRSLKEFAHPAETERVDADVNRAVESTLAIATNEYKYVADLQLELGDLPPVRCHINEINQAVLNIVVNAAHAIGDAVKGTDRRGLITVRTVRDGDWVIIAVSDTGGGIPEAIRPRIFDPFFTTKEVGKGTGQGLAIAWSTVRDRHGGDLTFDTVTGKGTTFFLRIPIAGPEPAS
jgi:PAS domain S-box-containing protein